MPDASGVVTLHIWRVPARRLAAVGWRMAADRRALRSLPGVSFAKLLGTAPGFGPTSADLSRWAALLVWDGTRAAARFDQTRPARRWRALATAYGRLDLRLLSTRGTWSGHNPWPGHGLRADADADTRNAGPVMALTRATLRPSRAMAFWRALRAPARAITGAPGLVTAFGIGEVPLARPGTVSLWRDAQHLVEFAYRNPDHQRVVHETPGRRWYSEELFARFAVVAVTGDHDVIGWRAEEMETPR